VTATSLISALRTAGRVVLGLLGVGFGCGAWMYLSLPDVRALQTTNPSTTAFIELRAREARARGETPRRVQQWVEYGRISSQLKRAVLVAEDSAFWQHDGVDYEQLKESMEVNLERMEFARGASTITQQLAKNLYLSPSKNPIRKARELLIARRLEAELSKQRILEIYLNVIEWGDGVYGAEAAARTYFHKPASDLTSQESALLAGALVNARLLNPAHPTARLRARQQLVLRRMGRATPPPVVAGPVVPEPGVPVLPEPAPVEALPDLPVPTGAPEALPGQSLPVPAAPAPRPPGRRPGSEL
jgi:monofunctional biosynthetic peptidoglycan transglycosylase